RPRLLRWQGAVPKSCSRPPIGGLHPAIGGAAGESPPPPRARCSGGRYWQRLIVPRSPVSRASQRLSAALIIAGTGRARQLKISKPDWKRGRPIGSIVVTWKSYP